MPWGLDKPPGLFAVWPSSETSEGRIGRRPEVVMKRRSMSRRGSRKSFSRGANRIHKKNMLSSVGSQYAMRGGIRL